MTSHRFAVTALFTAGLGWGTTGLFVRLLSEKGLSIDELLFVRLVVAGLLLFPFFIYSVFKNTSMNIRWMFFFGVSTTFYYLGAITAFRYLPVFLAALIIGLSPVLAWVLDFRSGQRSNSAGFGVGLATTGLLLLTLNHILSNGSLGDFSQGQTGEAFSHRLIGVFGALLAAAVTVINARLLKSQGSMAPKALQISIATVLVGGTVSSFMVNDFSDILGLVNQNIGLTLGFGFFATAIPGVAMAYASARLNPQATATVSIQLQVWAGVFAWVVLKESLSVLQIVAFTFAVGGSWICATARTG